MPPLLALPPRLWPTPWKHPRAGAWLTSAVLPRFPRAGAWLALAGLGLLAGGCDTPLQLFKPGYGPAYQPANVYAEVPFLPQEVRRVAVLPLTVAEDTAAFASARTSLGPVVVEELGKTRLLEVISVKADELRAWTGQAAWRASDRLQTNLLARLREKTGCDAVLFAHLGQFSGYPPLRLGWNLRLLTCEEQKTLWSADEVFDASKPEVANGARRYYGEANPKDKLLDPEFILSSPTGFAHYSLATLLATLPRR